MFEFKTRLQDVVLHGLTDKNGRKERDINPTAVIHCRELLHYLSDHGYEEPVVQASVEDGGLSLSWSNDDRTVIIEVKSNIVEIDCWTKKIADNQWVTNAFAVTRISSIFNVLDEWI